MDNGTRVNGNKVIKATTCALALCLVLVASFGMAACSSGTSGKYNAGTYTGTGTGAGGDVTVTMTIASDGTITVADDGVKGSNETSGIGGREACEDGTFAEQINAAQSAEIDGVSGATLTSNGVREAIEDALAQAQA